MHNVAMTSRTGLWASLLVALLIFATGCGGGGGDSILPTVTAVTPTGVVGITGSPASFTATVGNLVAGATFTWNFGGGATPNASSDATPDVTLGTTGSYLGSVQVCNPDGCAPTFTFNYTVSAPTSPPVISAVTPLSGFVGENVEFIASASNSPATWSWTFGGAATPNTSTSAKPIVLLGAAGTYNGTVTAANVAGISAPFPFVITVSAPTAAPTVTAVDPDGVAGESGDTVTFKGTASQGPSSWTWEFGGGTLPNASTDIKPSVQLERPGFYTGSVTATNALGDSVPFPFGFSVDVPTLPIWNQHQVDGSANSALSGYDISQLEGRPVVAYATGSGTGLTIARAKIAMPRKESDWDRYEIEPGVGFVSGFNPSIAIVNGRLAVSHVRLRTGTLDEPTLLYSRATTDNPVSSSAWNTSTIITEAAIGDTNLVVLPSGFPAIGYVGPLLRPKVAVADTALPSGSGDWQPHFIAAAAFDNPMDIAVVAGKLQVILSGADGLQFLSTNEDEPVSAADWTRHEPLTALESVQPGQIIDGGGFPIIALGNDANESVSRLLVLRGDVAVPDTSADWTGMTADGTSGTGLGVGITRFDNRIVISHYEAVAPGVMYELQAVRALTSDPEVATDWQEGVVIRSVALSPVTTQILGIDGRLRIIGAIEPMTRLNIFQAEDVW